MSGPGTGKVVTGSGSVAGSWSVAGSGSVAGSASASGSVAVKRRGAAGPDPYALEKESELLPRDLPSGASRAMAAFLIGLVVAAAGIAFLVELPESVKCPFVLVPEDGADPVKSPRRGTIERLSVEDGAEVKKGDHLFTVRSEELRVLAAERAMLERQIESARGRLGDVEAENAASALSDRAATAELAARVERLEREQEAGKALDESLVAEHRTQLEAARAQAQGLAQQAEGERRRETTAREMRDQAEEAFREGVIAQGELLRQRDAYEDAVQRLERAVRAAADAEGAILELEAAWRRQLDARKLATARVTGDLAEARAARDRITQDAEARTAAASVRVRQLREEIATAVVKLPSLARELEGADGDLLPVLAPYDGVVVGLAARRAGVVIERGEVLCEIARAGATLRAEMAVPEKDAGKVSAGQSVRLLLASYPYPRYGTRAAKLAWVSPSGTAGGFRAFAALEDPTVVVDGVARSLRAGMTGEARIVTGSRTLIEFVFEPLRQLRENVGGDGSKGGG